MLDQVVKACGDVAMIEQRPMMEGRRMVMIIGPRGGVVRTTNTNAPAPTPPVPSTTTPPPNIPRPTTVATGPAPKTVATGPAPKPPAVAAKG